MSIRHKDGQAASESALENEQDLALAISAYYTDYYRDQLGLRDWAARVENRFDEENTHALTGLKWLDAWINYDFRGKRVLVVGAGTGSDVFLLHSRGALVFGIEPGELAARIISAKARLKYNRPNSVARAIAELLPFADQFFDFVYCFSFVEHVQRPLVCCDEMLRVLRPDGYLFIETVDYRFPFEGHYRISWPILAPKCICKLYLAIRGRPTGFVDTINFINHSKLRRYFQTRQAHVLHYYPPIPETWRHAPRLTHRLWWWLTYVTGIQKNLWLLVRKKI